WVEIVAPAWTRIQFSLPDGTKGWLNSNSKLRYNGDFYEHRQVTLNGEAFFDVYKDSKRPFVLNTNDIAIKVLGTRFNIASYENEKNVEVVLEEGKIELKEKGTDKSFTMKPNDLIVYDKAHNDYSLEIVQPQKYLSWTEGKLTFRNDPLDVVARRLERWYNIDVEINGNVSQNHRLRATFIDEDLEEVLNLLKRSLPIDFRIVHRCLQADDTYAKRKVIITCQ
ncbi:MAG: FecR domain-containing protein, partial [Prolixibacteraceae bacterium]